MIFLPEPGVNSDLLLDITGSPSFVQIGQTTVTVIAVPILSTVTLQAVMPTVFTVSRNLPAELILRIDLQWLNDNAALFTTLTLAVTTSPTVRVEGTGEQRISDIGTLLVPLSVFLGDTRASSLHFFATGIADYVTVLSYPASAVFQPRLTTVSLTALEPLPVQRYSGQRLVTSLSITVAATDLDRFELNTMAGFTVGSGDLQLIPSGVLSFQVGRLAVTREIRLSVLPDPGVQSTVVVSIAGTAADQLLARLFFMVHAAVPIAPLELDNIEGVSVTDLLLVLRLQDAAASSSALVVNLQLEEQELSSTGMAALREQLAGDQSLVDVTGDRGFDAADIRVLLRYISGLRGAALGEQPVDILVLYQLLGLPIDERDF